MATHVTPDSQQGVLSGAKRKQRTALAPPRTQAVVGRAAHAAQKRTCQNRTAACWCGSRRGQRADAHSRLAYGQPRRAHSPARCGGVRGGRAHRDRRHTHRSRSPAGVTTSAPSRALLLTRTRQRTHQERQRRVPSWVARAARSRRRLTAACCCPTHTSQAVCACVHRRAPRRITAGKWRAAQPRHSTPRVRRRDGGGSARDARAAIVQNSTQTSAQSRLKKAGPYSIRL